MGLGGWSIHLGRRQDAAHREAVETLVRDAELAKLAEEPRARAAARGMSARRQSGPTGCDARTMPGKAD